MVKPESAQSPITSWMTIISHMMEEFIGKWIKGNESGKRSKKRKTKKRVAHPIKRNFRRHLFRAPLRIDLFCSVDEDVTILAFLAIRYGLAWQWSVKVDIMMKSHAVGIAKTISIDMCRADAAIRVCLTIRACRVVVYIHFRL